MLRYLRQPMGDGGGGDIIIISSHILILSIFIFLIVFLNELPQQSNFGIFIHIQISKNIGTKMLTAPNYNVNKLETIVYQ